MPPSISWFSHIRTSNAQWSQAAEAHAANSRITTCAALAYRCSSRLLARAAAVGMDAATAVGMDAAAVGMDAAAAVGMDAANSQLGCPAVKLELPPGL